MTEDIRVKIEEYLEGSPFVVFMGLQLVDMDPSKGVLSFRMELRPEFERSAKHDGRWHGGVISALADTAGNFALIMLHEAPPPTINIRIDYLRPVTGQFVVATALVRKSGRTIAFIDIEITNENGDLVAIGRANYATVGLFIKSSKEAVL